MFVAVLIKCCYDSVYGKDTLESCNQEEEHLFDESLDEFGIPKKKPRISPPVHSMLELMLKDPEGFSGEYEDLPSSYTWVHDYSSVRFTEETRIMDASRRDYYVNDCRITEEEGLYLLQGVDYLNQKNREKREEADKKLRYETDRKIRKVLEENNL